MFTGIIETLGEVVALDAKATNLDITIKSNITSELKIDQSVAHNGVCLTVVSIDENQDIYRVTAIDETLNKTNLGNLEINDLINLERGALINSRLDGHIVQGHVDQTAKCILAENKNGSWLYRFEYDTAPHNVTIEKGSITINGVSLTVVDSDIDSFSVAIIPFTYEHTTFKSLTVGDIVNLEFDVIGKYVKRLMLLKD